MDEDMLVNEDRTDSDSGNSGCTDFDVEADLEVDQLDSSESDQETAAAQPASISTATKKGAPGKPGVRVPGHTILPQARIENILQADGVTGNLALSKDGQFILSVATEEFIKRLAQTGFQRARTARQQNMVNYQDMANIAEKTFAFRFLKQTIPQPLTLTTAWELRGMRHMELMEEDPALGGVIPEGNFLQHQLPGSPEVTPSVAVASSSSATSKRKKNGAEPQVNGHASGSSSSRRAPEIASISTTPSQVKASSSMGSTSKNGSTGANGHSTPATTATATPSEEKDDAMDEDEINDGDEDDEMNEDEPPWPKPQNPPPFTGPASGYLQGPAAPFGRADQGRTIYSQKNQPD
ncbi:hypothetical protein EST38_g2451 [Candolleomyces aberdarensis]|uniref:Transcription factor CBF/NF-Y/archaeal histone domain-containing protein n=1 Tax=Candolleomyces aberdarensis TaxID=2316362 RepID=A0A4Q2DSU9_9AGAR|nr:hypothetical protein EST38_g2451 [Candolleomyces aberdarensis]